MQATIDKILVIFDNDVATLRTPPESALLTRAVELARTSGCALELFYVAGDSSGGGASHSALREAARLDQLTPYAAKLAEMARWLQSLGLTVGHDVQWDQVPSASIARKVQDTHCDLVLKECRGHDGYDCLTDADQDMVDSIPLPIWFAREAHQSLRAITVGVRPHLSQRWASAKDHHVLRWATTLAKMVDAKVRLFHGCAPVETHAARRCHQAAENLWHRGVVNDLAVSEHGTLVGLRSAAVAFQAQLVIISKHDRPQLDDTGPQAATPCDILLIPD